MWPSSADDDPPNSSDCCPPPSPIALRISIGAVAAGVMTRGMPRCREPNRCVRGRCYGTGFDRDVKNRASRRCPRCKGEGSTRVGSTKR
jgi:hypothetical protein